jgi:MATE family multidrug resistance protein
MNKEILRLAIPNIISNVSIPLLSTIDTALMGQLSALHLGAVGLSSMLFNFIYWNFGFLRMGTTGMTAQAYGANNEHEIAAVLTRGLGLAFLLAILIFTFRNPIYDASAVLLNVSGDQSSFVREYFDIRIYGAPASLALFCLMGWFFGMQNALIPLVITIIINVVNMALSAYLVNVKGMEIRGVAIGTVVAQYLGLIIAIVAIIWKYRDQVKKISLAYLQDINAIKGYLEINRDLFIRTVCLTFGFGFFYSMSSKAGALILAVNVILQQFLNWMSYAIDGFAYASESLVGKYYGAKDYPGAIKSIKYSFIWGLGFAVLFLIIYALFGVPILRIFTDEQDVIAATKPYLWWVAIIPLFAFVSYIWDGIYIGLTASRTMRNAMFISLVLYLGSFYVGAQYLDPINNLWISLLIFLSARGVIQYLYYKKYGLEMP